MIIVSDFSHPANERGEMKAQGLGEKFAFLLITVSS